MIHQAENDPKATLKALQQQFRDLCVIGMRGAEAISSFRENPKEKLAGYGKIPKAGETTCTHLPLTV